MILNELSAILVGDASVTPAVAGVDINGVLLVVGTTLFEARMPPEPDECVSTYEAPGAVVSGLGNTTSYEIPRLQVMTRSLDYDTARNNIEKISQYLRNLPAITAQGTLYTDFEVNTPLPMPADDKDRWRFLLSVTCYKNVSSTV